LSLTKLQQAFIAEFTADPKIGKEEAARRAGYSKYRAQVTACELMKNPEIQREIERKLNKRLDKLEVTQESVLKELQAIIEAAKEAGAGHWQMQARLKATELLGKHLKMFSDKIEVGPTDALMELLLEGRKRAGLAATPVIHYLKEARAVSSTAELQLGKDIANFYADPLGFVMYAYPWGRPGLLEKHDGPDVWQRDFLTELGKQVRERNFDGLNPVSPIRMVVVSGHGVGKSVLCAWITHWIMSTRPRCHGTISANTFNQLQTKTFAAVQSWARLLINKHWFALTSESMYFRGQKDSWFASAAACKEENAESFAGQHAADSTSFYFFDEGSAIPEKIWETAEGGLTDGEPMFFACGNPTRNTGKFQRITFGNERERWTRFSVDSRNSRFTNKEQIKQWIEDYGEDSDFVRVRVRG
jgi:hypothetical protein